MAQSISEAAVYRILITEDVAGIAGAIAAQAARRDMETMCVQNFHNVMGEFAESGAAGYLAARPDPKRI